MGVWGCVCGACVGASVWVCGCGCVFGCVCVGACVIQVYVCVRVLPRVCACMGACLWVRVCLCWRVRMGVCGYAFVSAGRWLFVCIYVCVRGRMTERVS